MERRDTSAADVRPGFGLPEMSVVPELTHSGRTVLFAEDDDDLRYVTTCLLAAQGYRVLACADAEVAVERFETEGRVDLLLTDYQMPGRTGLELARELTELSPRLPVVIVTGSLLGDDMLREIAERGWLHLTKPCPVPGMHRALEAAVRAAEVQYESHGPAG